MHIIIKCPYCGHENKVYVETFHGHALANCDLESGGCEELFFYDWSTTITARTARIEFMKEFTNGTRR